MPDRLRQALPALVGLALFLAALEILRTELRAVSWSTLTSDIWSTPPSRLALALLLTAVNYLVLTTYDFLAFAYVGRSLEPRRILGASFLAYAISSNIGFSMLSGSSVRFRFYSRWGITASEFARIVVSCVVTFWLGLLLIGGLSLVLSPLTLRLDLPLEWLVAPSVLLMLLSLAYVGASVARVGADPVSPHELLPPPGIAGAVACVGCRLGAGRGGAVCAASTEQGWDFPFLGVFPRRPASRLASHVPEAWACSKG